ATALCCANGLLLTMVLRRAVPRLGNLAVAAGVLLVVNRADPSRFFVMWTTNFYLTALFFFLVALWLLLLSHDRGSRPLLLLACVALAASLLSYEGGYPLALLGPVLLRARRRDGGRYLVWCCAWLGALAVLAGRLLVFLLGHGKTYHYIQSS